jgi:hypothetical protein
MAAFICPMVAGGTILAGIEPGPTVVLVGGTLSAFLAAGTLSLLRYMAGARVRQWCPDNQSVRLNEVRVRL